MTQAQPSKENPDSSARTNTPWYKQFWPWVVILLPASSVIAGLTTLWIAIENKDSVVSNNWYKEGKTINQSFAAEKRAQDMGLTARGTWYAEQRLLCVHLNPVADVDATLLTLLLQHPTLIEQDIRLQLVFTAAKHAWCAPLANAPSGRRSVTLAPVQKRELSNAPATDHSTEASVATPPWRLHKEVYLQDGSFVL